MLIRGNHEPVNRLALNESIETRSLPTLARCYPRQLYLDHSHCPVLVPATLAALPSTRATSDRDVFYVTHPIRSIVSRQLPPRSTVTSRRNRPCHNSIS